jgi:electron transport complex protein RnfG
MYTLTKEPIEASKKAKQENAIKIVLPPFEKIAPVETFTIAELGDFKVFRAYDNNDQFVGAAVESFSKNGFSGEISIMVGFDIDGNIVDYSVLNQKETPGLGTKMVDWFKTEKGNQSIKSKNPVKTNFTVSKDGGEIDAITAATISSRAFLEAVRSAYRIYAESIQQMVVTIGATEMTNKNDSTVLEISK